MGDLPWSVSLVISVLAEEAGLVEVSVIEILVVEVEVVLDTV